MDKLTAAARSDVMRRVRSRDTGPELRVRRLAHGMGYRYRLNVSGLPGKPDLVFAGRSKAIFVHGCFWHGHNCRRGQNRPTANTEYWSRKLARNQERDKVSQQRLRQLGWRVLVVWECQLSNELLLRRRLERFLEL